MPHDREMVMSGVEPILLEQMVEHRLDLSGGNERGLAAHLTNQMLMIVLHRQMPTTRLVAEMDVMDQPDLGQIVECPIRRGRIDRDAVCLDSTEDLLGCEKPFIVARQHGANGATRHREPQTCFTNSLVNGVLETWSGLTHQLATIATSTPPAMNLYCNCLQQGPVAP